jgi:DNA-binding winged helix-turn-helix (wHTH) protein/tetratricopeptide (TPR) repeat protein
VRPARDEAVYRFSGFQLDLAAEVLRGPDGVDLTLRPKSFALLRHLVENPGQLHSREALLDLLWPGLAITDDSLTQCVSDLRRALGEASSLVLRTVPRRGYVLTADVQRAAVEHLILEDEPRPADPPPPPRASVAGRRDLVTVQRIECPDDRPECLRLAGALSTDLLAELARFEDLQVRAGSEGLSPDGFRVCGEARLAGAQCRIAIRLEDAATGAVLWSDRVEHAWDQMPELPDEALNRLAAGLDREIAKESLRRARQRPLAELTPHELCLLGRHHHHRGTEADTLVARDLFARAMAADPDFATPFAWQAYTVHRAITHGWGSPDGQEARDHSLRLARHAVKLAPDSPLSLSRLGFSLMLSQRWDEAVDAARSALRTGRSADYVSRNTCGVVLTQCGHAGEAVEAVRQTLTLDPFCPPTTRAVLGRALLLAGDAAAALAELRWCAARLPDYAAGFHTLVVAAVETGELEEAEAALRTVFRLRPGWVPSNHSDSWVFRRECDLERFLSAFRAAGWAGPGASALPTEPARLGAAPQEPGIG